ncbi:MAG: hypothetical protein WC867_03670 [Candidatus Pacearchaeota archaeon]
MTEIYQVPKLTSIPSLESTVEGDLTGNNPNYVNMLEESLKVRQNHHQSQLFQLEKLGRSFIPCASSKYREIQGVSITEYEDSENLEEKARTISGNGLIKTINIYPLKIVHTFVFQYTCDESDEKRTFRQILDVEDSFNRVYEDQVSVVCDNINLIQDEIKNYTAKLLDLTKITPLTDTRTEGIPTQLHFFMPRKDGVYHVNVEIDDVHPEIQPELIPGLDERLFKEKGFFEEFKKQYTNLNPAYLITNPSEVLDKELLFINAVSITTNDLLNQYLIIEQKETEKLARNNPIELLCKIIGKRESREE